MDMHCENQKTKLEVFKDYRVRGMRTVEMINEICTYRVRGMRTVEMGNSELSTCIIYTKLVVIATVSCASSRELEQRLLFKISLSLVRDGQASLIASPPLSCAARRKNRAVLKPRDE